ncbi:MAG: hypothetical protein K9N51_00830 [Candidatus Pacebacteria bacterium]|nr:hypothetical protein [Candidatus Paceibacterota bacterium]
MNNRETLMRAIRREPPKDRIPYTYEARAESDARFRQYLGLGADKSVAEHFGCNNFTSLWSGLGAGPSLPERTARNRTDEPGVSVDIWGCRRERIQAGSAVYSEVTHHPLANAETIADVEAYDWPTPDEVVFPEVPAGFDLGTWKADKVVLEMGFIGPFGVPWAMVGLEKMMLDLALNPGLIEAVVANVEAFTLGCLDIIFRKYPGAVDLIGSGDDYGTQNGLLISNDMIGQFFMPSLKRHYDLGKKHGAMGYHHCCGAIFDMIPQLIEAGVNVLNPIQTSAAGMDPARIKKAYGKDLCFHGGIDIQQTLVTGTPEDVRAEVRSRIETLGPEGYILAPSHTLQPDTPPENLVAMYDEVRSWKAEP